MPAIMIGRNERVAWGITNNISSLRDLYMERLEQPDGTRSFYDGEWHPIEVRQEEIAVRDAESVCHTIRSTRNGPLVDSLLPVSAQQLGPISLRWIGHGACDWVGALISGQSATGCRGQHRLSMHWCDSPASRARARPASGLGSATPMDGRHTLE
jgi:acyl-homoserine lactone acylase PvdQ